MAEYTDFPIEEVIEKADYYVRQGAKVHQKWTCLACGSRQTMEAKNIFFRRGTCEECGKVSFITHCNYVTMFGVPDDL